MTQRVRDLVTKAGNLNSIPRPQVWKERAYRFLQSCRLSTGRCAWAVSSYMLAWAQTHTRTWKKYIF